jgi:hypothetical protein
LLFPGIPVSSTNKTDRHDIAEIFFTVALSTIGLTSEHYKINAFLKFVFHFLQIYTIKEVYVYVS